MLCLYFIEFFNCHANSSLTPLITFRSFSFSVCFLNIHILQGHEFFPSLWWNKNLIFTMIYLYTIHGFLYPVLGANVIISMQSTVDTRWNRWNICTMFVLSKRQRSGQICLCCGFRWNRPGWRLPENATQGKIIKEEDRQVLTVVKWMPNSNNKHSTENTNENLHVLLKIYWYI